MKVVMLAAGIGARIGQSMAETVPKILLRFDGKSLLERHIDIFRRQGISELVLGVGFHHDDIQREIETLGAQDFVRTVHNKDFEQGSIVTLSILHDEICCGEPVLVMDADVLYDARLLERLANSPHPNCLLIDRAFVPGDEPVKVCVRNGEIVEFRKKYPMVHLVKSFPEIDRENPNLVTVWSVQHFAYIVLYVKECVLS